MSWYATICLSRILLELLAVNKVVLQPWIQRHLIWMNCHDQAQVETWPAPGRSQFLPVMWWVQSPWQEAISDVPVPLTSPMKWKRHCGIANSTLYPAQSKHTLKKPCSGYSKLGDSQPCHDSIWVNFQTLCQGADPWPVRPTWRKASICRSGPKNFRNASMLRSTTPDELQFPNPKGLLVSFFTWGHMRCEGKIVLARWPCWTWWHKLYSRWHNPDYVLCTVQLNRSENESKWRSFVSCIYHYTDYTK